MAKRLTSTEKWNDPWFCELSPTDKLFWIYLIDNCNHAGIWQVNWPLARFHLGEFIFNERAFNGRIVKLTDEKWFIPKFLTFQYGELNPENRAHQSVLILLKKEGVSKGLVSPLQGAKDMDIAKDKDKDIVSVGQKFDLCAPIVYLNEKAKSHYDPKSKSNMDLVRARFNEGRTLEQFKSVINKKVDEWLSNEKMHKYLRPSTLFNRTHFEEYLNAPERGKENILDKYEVKK